MPTVRTRFAPSPTGYMHIGGMRTALFNWLWARKNGGQFILRIDDTDQQRNMEEALQPILDAFRWLGLDWDEGPEVGGEFGPYFQSERRPLHDAALAKLLESKAAYRDFEPPEETKAQREAAEKQKVVYTSSRTSLNLSDDEVAAKLEAGDAHVVRFLVPRDRKVAIDDNVRGHIEWDCSLMVDPVIARGDGSPLYNFATAVDDGQLQISHVIRAEEHLSNTPIQVLLHEALGNTLPQFAHIPFVAAPGGKKKLSKRDIDKYRKSPAFQKLFQLGDEVLSKLGIDAGDQALSPVMVAYYREVGFLPAGVLNGLSRLGWSLDDETENMSLETVQENFSLQRVVKASASLDPDKLMSYQSHWMHKLADDERLAGCVAMLVKAELLPAEPDQQMLDMVAKVVSLAADRLRVFGDILGMDEFFVSADTLQYDTKEFQKRVVKPDTALDLLAALRKQFADQDSFKAEPLHDLVQSFVEDQQIKFGQIAPALRLSVTGKAKGADLFPTLELLGQDECLQRIDRAIGMAESMRVV
ncbi:glutamate--tRNA ligase [Fuerstiella marisgermanici]|uniref:Glutamate--tRNA ligase n=1 Tax=Fuerstiella marisgermanici TaxID=1891926 RepID=A0A1P8WHM3_9PLAN|nr:glutamate--tRNA ligase [Fuerstiella marisgermanici]APZ93558.1 Glutamate--tRNA ligase [Fuerstiella marisgermanici]